jgi:hypothetical protein
MDTGVSPFAAASSFRHCAPLLLLLLLLVVVVVVVVLVCGIAGVSCGGIVISIGCGAPSGLGVLCKWYAGRIQQYQHSVT